jgi:hypothetical protein
LASNSSVTASARSSVRSTSPAKVSPRRERRATLGRLRRGQAAGADLVEAGVDPQGGFGSTSSTTA